MSWVEKSSWPYGDPEGERDREGKPGVLTSHLREQTLRELTSLVRLLLLPGSISGWWPSLLNTGAGENSQDRNHNSGSLPMPLTERAGEEQRQADEGRLFSSPFLPPRLNIGRQLALPFRSTSACPVLGYESLPELGSLNKDPYSTTQ